MMAMHELPDELWIHICKYFLVEDLCKCDVVSKLFNKFSKENGIIWRNCRKWSNNFWGIAESRNPKLSKPLGSYRKEVFRLLNFEDLIAPYKISIEDYIIMWKYFDSQQLKEDIESKIWGFEIKSESM